MIERIEVEVFFRSKPRDVGFELSDGEEEGFGVLFPEEFDAEGGRLEVGHLTFISSNGGEIEVTFRF